MSIQIINQPPIYLTEDELARLRYEYQQAYLMYSGVPLTFEAWVRAKSAATMLRERAK